MTRRAQVGWVSALLLFLAACQEDGPNSPASATPSPDLFEAQRTDCERSGGRWGPGGGTATFVCYQETRDANQQCRAETDCESLCLARSRTCAPIKPFLGCHEVLTAAGAPATLCVN